MFPFSTISSSAHQCRCGGFWSGSSLPRLLLGGVPQCSLHWVPRQGDVQLLRKLLQLLAGHRRAVWDVQVGEVHVHNPTTTQMNLPKLLLKSRCIFLGNSYNDKNIFNIYHYFFWKLWRITCTCTVFHVKFHFKLLLDRYTFRCMFMFIHYNTFISTTLILGKEKIHTVIEMTASEQLTKFHQH